MIKDPEVKMVVWIWKFYISLESSSDTLQSKLLASKVQLEKTKGLLFRSLRSRSLMKNIWILFEKVPRIQSPKEKNDVREIMEEKGLYLRIVS